jgi:hypothetical protein
MKHAAIVTVVFLLASPLFAHCDSMSGPVVVAAKQALEKRDVAAVLKWVPASGEQEIREAFEQTLKVRAASPEAKALADRWFFETVVRVHRAGEGEGFTGLTNLPPEEGIALADHAVHEGSLEPVKSALAGAVNAGLAKRFEAVQHAARKADESVEAGRHYVAAYVEFIHYVERLHQAAESSAAHGMPHAAEH